MMYCNILQIPNTGNGRARLVEHGRNASTSMNASAGLAASPAARPRSPTSEAARSSCIARAAQDAPGAKTVSFFGRIKLRVHAPRN